MDDEYGQFDEEEPGFRPEDVLDPQWERQQKKVSNNVSFPGLDR